MKLTKSLIDKTEGGARDLFLWDSTLSGFGVRIKSVGSGGARSFVVQYRADGRSRRMTLGRYGHLTLDQARRKARSVLGRVADGQDPVGEARERRQGVTVAGLAERYLDEHARVRKKPSSVKADQCNVRNHVTPRLGHLRIDEVERRHVAKLHHDMRATPGAANRVLALLSKMFNLAEIWGLRTDGSNPCRHVQRYPENKVERFLSEEELGRLGAALAQAETDGTERREVMAAIRLLVLTGCRVGEILTLRWEYVDLERRCLRLPDSKTGAKLVPLNEPAIAVMEGLARKSDWVLPGRVRGKPLANIQKPWKRICAVVKIPDLRIHDLRHSFASVGAGAGMSLLLIGRLLGHAQATTTERYAHLSVDPLLQASESIGSRISAAMDHGDPAQRG